MPANLTPVQIYTDGACKGNPGPGGYGVVLEAPGHKPKELSAGYRKTTNNRMELLAVIAGLKALKKSDVDVTVYSDSTYVVKAINEGWVFGWLKKGFKDKKNADLWRVYLQLHQKFNPTLIWIKGHNNHPQNERCDKLAVAAATSENLLIDEGYETLTGSNELF